MEKQHINQEIINKIKKSKVRIEIIKNIDFLNLSSNTSFFNLDYDEIFKKRLKKIVLIYNDLNRYLCSLKENTPEYFIVGNNPKDKIIRIENYLLKLKLEKELKVVKKSVKKQKI